MLIHVSTVHKSVNLENTLNTVKCIQRKKSSHTHTATHAYTLPPDWNAHLYVTKILSVIKSIKCGKALLLIPPNSGKSQWSWNSISTKRLDEAVFIKLPPQRTIHNPLWLCNLNGPKLGNNARGLRNPMSIDREDSYRVKDVPSGIAGLFRKLHIS